MKCVRVMPCVALFVRAITGAGGVNTQGEHADTVVAAWDSLDPLSEGSQVVVTHTSPGVFDGAAVGSFAFDGTALVWATSHASGGATDSLGFDLWRVDVGAGPYHGEYDHELHHHHHHHHHHYHGEHCNHDHGEHCNHDHGEHCDHDHGEQEFENYYYY